MAEKLYKLVRTITVPVQVENEPTQHRRTQETVYSGKTWAEAKEIRRTNRYLTPVQERTS